MPAVSAPRLWPTSVNRPFQCSDRIMACKAATCSSSVKVASAGAIDLPKPSRSIAITRYSGDNSGTTFTQLSDDELIP